MLTIDQTVDLEADAAHHKVALARTPGLFAVRTMLAGAYIGIGVLVMLTAGGPLRQAGSPWAPLVQGLVFGVANMTTFSLGLFGALPHATVAEFARNVVWVGLGNLVGERC